ncbi:MAG: hypothetical protein HOZ81_50485 [Streptomyces sp.]|nr:hypothetical protein [Streptomyces sp.]NUS24403.1 hypothetical protein [Streptomyces sp.]
MTAVQRPAALQLPPPVLPADYRPLRTLLPGLVVELDCRPAERRGVYVSPECQLGAHHGCPGGIRETSGGTALACHCPAGTCDCYKPRPLTLVT